MLAAKLEAILPHLDERQRRLLLGAEARALGHGRTRAVAKAAGVVTRWGPAPGRGPRTTVIADQRVRRSKLVSTLLPSVIMILRSSLLSVKASSSSPSPS